MSIVIDQKKYTEDDILDMISELQDFKEQEQELEEKNELYVTENEDLKYKLELQIKRNTEFFKEIKAMQHKLDQKAIFKDKGIHDRMKHYEKKCSEQESKINLLESKQNSCGISKEQKDKICKANKALKLMNENKDIKIKELEEQNQNYFLQMNQYKDELTSLKERCEKSHANNEQLRKNNQRLVKENKEAKKSKDNILENDDRDNIISTLKEEIGELKVTVKEIKKECNKKDKKIQDLEDELDIIIEEEQEKSPDLLSKYNSKCEEFRELFNKYNTYYDFIENNKYNNNISEKMMESIETQTDNRLEEKPADNNNISEKIMESIETQTDNRLEEKPAKETITNKEYNRVNINAVFDLVFKEKMKKTNDEKIYRRLTNKRNDISKKILNDLVKDNDKLDYGSEFVKCIIDLM